MLFFFKNNIIFKNILWLLSTEILNKIIIFIIWIKIIRNLWPENYGLYTFILSIISFLLILIDSKMDQLIIRIGYNNLSNLKLYLYNFLLTKIIIFIIIFILSYSYFGLINYEYLNIYIYLFITTFLKHLTSFFNTYYKWFEKMKIEWLLQINNSIILLILFYFYFYFLWNNIDILNISVIYLITSIINFFISIIVFNNFKKNIPKEIKVKSDFSLMKYKSFIKEYFSTIIILLLSLFSVNLYYIWDQFLLGYFWYINELWIYWAYYALLINFLIFFRIIKSTLNPKLIKKIQNNDHFLIFFKKITKKLIIFSTFILIIMLLIWFDIFNILLWDSFIILHSKLIYYNLLISIYGMIFVVNYSNTILLFEWYDKKYLLWMFLWGIINILLNIFIIPEHWALGASISTLISVLFLLLYMKLLFNKIIINYEK